MAPKAPFGDEAGVLAGRVERGREAVEWGRLDGVLVVHIRNAHLDRKRRQVAGLDRAEHIGKEALKRALYVRAVASDRDMRTSHNLENTTYPYGSR